MPQNLNKAVPKAGRGVLRMASVSHQVFAPVTTRRPSSRIRFRNPTLGVGKDICGVELTKCVCPR
jgi:hypothetical protein